MKFEGYKAAWNRCPDCGQGLVWAVKGKSLKHRSSGVAGTGRQTHELVMRKKAEAHGMRLPKMAR
jgi:hypothetical protein